uniref:non-specific serine/threonine protein kinase n=1 Tax=Stigmatella aurantiaca Sg a15 TaxID=675526 RepID=A0A3Q8I4G2_STIAU|nr:serine/threonine-protein kinase Pkn3 [Stigmatella aurantiaca Sg a15]
MMDLMGPEGLRPGTQVDGWMIVKALGAGGFGAVHQVEKHGQPFAMKLALHKEDSGDAKQTHARTRRELTCLLHLNHPNIVKARAHGQWPDMRQGHLYLILDYIDGWTLAEWAERMHPTFHELVRVFEQIAAALSYMHARGVFHRDLKLTNLLIRKSDGVPILIDFGVGDYSLAEELTDLPLPPGTERYRAPEANRFWREHKNGRKAKYEFKVADELFAFGVMLHDLLTEPLPTRRTARTPLNNDVVPPPPVEEKNPRIPEALASLVRKLLSREPHRRPENFESVRRELAELVAHQGSEYQVPHHPPFRQQAPSRDAGAGKAPAEAKLRKVWQRRRPGALRGLLGAAALVLVASLATPSPDAFLLPSGATVQFPLQEEGSHVTQKSSATSAQRATIPSRFVTPTEFLAWCKTAAILGMVVAVEAGCPGAQVRPMPSDLEDCPPEVQKVMEELGVKSDMFITVDIRQPSTAGGYVPGDDGTYGDGPVIGRVEPWDNQSKIPTGSLLFGYLWTEVGPRVIGRYDRVQFPNGKEFPVCMALSNRSFRDGIKKHPGSKPGAAKIGRIEPVAPMPL